MFDKTKLDCSREEIDAIDKELCRLFARRQNIALDVAKYKLQNNLPVFQGDREKQVLQKIIDNLPDSLRTAGCVLFQTIMEVSKFEQSKFMPNKETEFTESPTTPLIIACQGGEGAYSSIVAEKIFADEQIDFYADFEDVFKAVDSKKAHFGILPYENSTAGSVISVYDLMQHYNFYIHKCVKLSAKHCLLGVNGADIGDIKTVYSHPQALSQCSTFLKNNDIKGIEYSNTALAAQFVSKLNDKSVGAVASSNCAEKYDLSILQCGIQNNNENYTRFIIISKDRIQNKHANKASFMLSLPHREGALNRIMSVISATGINISKIESRPIQGKPFEFLFYFDVEINDNGRDVYDLMNYLNNQCDIFADFGQYEEFSAE